jgi:hypothetical protein
VSLGRGAGGKGRAIYRRKPASKTISEFRPNYGGISIAFAETTCIIKAENTITPTGKRIMKTESDFEAEMDGDEREFAAAELLGDIERMCSETEDTDATLNRIWIRLAEWNGVKLDKMLRPLGTA